MGNVACVSKQADRAHPKTACTACPEPPVLPGGLAVAPVPREPRELVRRVREGVLGRNAVITTPFGERALTYADYTASGRALDFVEAFMAGRVMPMYANTHTEVSATGLQTTMLREEARHVIADCLNAHDAEDAVIFAGTGCTGAIHKLLCILGLYVPSQHRDRLLATMTEQERAVVFVSHMEHHRCTCAPAPRWRAR